MGLANLDLMKALSRSWVTKNKLDKGLLFFIPGTLSEFSYLIKYSYASEGGVCLTTLSVTISTLDRSRIHI